MATLDDFLANVDTPDNHKRLVVCPSLIAHLSDPGSSIRCEDMDRFIDGLTAWINSSSQKVSLNGLEIMCLLVSRMGDKYHRHVSNVLPYLLNKFGDSKDEVRESAQELVVRLMSPASTPGYVFERMQNGFTHKLWRVREQTMICLQNTLKYYGAKCLTLSKLVSSVVNLLEDQNSQVRETAINTLVEIYRHVGEKVRADLSKKDIPHSKLNTIHTRFDEAKKSGDMVATADFRSHSRSDFAGDNVDSAKPLFKTPTGAAPKKATAGRKSMFTKAPASGTSSGGLDEDIFINSFENVPKLQIFSNRDVLDHVQKCREVLSDTNKPWEKRVDSLKAIRAIFLSGAADLDDFLQNLRILEPCLVMSIKDLRSQVVREASITTAFLAQKLGNKFDHTAEVLIPHIIALLANSAKVMASSGVIAFKFIIQYTHSQRLVPLITSHLSSKASIIRRQSAEFLCLLLHTWPTHVLERHIAVLQEAIKKGISDADADCRAHSRKAYWGFADHFKDQANSLMDSLDSAKQKMLQGELSNSSSSNSLSGSGPQKIPKSRHRSASTDRTNAGPSAFVRAGFGRSSAVARVSSPRTDSTDGTYSSGAIHRSNSAHDLAGKARSAPKGPAARLASTGGAGNYNSLPRQRTTSGSTGVSHIISPERSRPRARVGVSQSQPGSRSSSPSSRFGYITRIPGPPSPSTPGPRRRSTGIPRSQGTSRETSPHRSDYTGRDRRLSGASRGPAQRVSNKTQGAQRVLGTGQDAEQFLADALGSNRRRYNDYDSDDAASETSSVCSERSYGSAYGRHSEEVGEILSNLSSSSWADRKQGLLDLQNLFGSGRVLNRTELKKLTEVFNRMFHEPHGKVSTIFLDTLMDLISVHKTELLDWLYHLLSRLLQKMGGDALASAQSKTKRCLECVRENFPLDQQFNILTRYIIDPSQTPNLKVKVKVALIQYLYELVLIMDPSDFSNSSDARLAISRIINWTSEPKSVEIRKGAQNLLVAMFSLNTPEFSMMLSSLPKSFQDGATKILHNHMRNPRSDSTGDVLSPRNITSPPRGSPRYRASPRHGSRDETENMNPEDIYDSIRKTSADIQNLSFNSKFDSPADGGMKKERDSTSQDSGIQSSLPDIRSDSPDTPGRARVLYNPSHYQDESINGYDRKALAEAVFDENELFNEELPIDQSDIIAEILSELSNHNKRHEERKNAMLQLIKMTREGTLGLWEEHFKTVLLLLLETLGDTDGHIRALSLRVLREILKSQPQRFSEYTELTVLKILEAHRDTVKEVTRAAEECASTLAKTVQPEITIRILIPITQTAEYPVSLAAIKVETKVIEQMSRDTILSFTPQLVPGLLKAYDDSESSVRKAAVFCLVSLYQVLGEDLYPHITDLNGSKMKLLKLYIKRAESQQKESSTSPSTVKTISPASSDTS